MDSRRIVKIILTAYVPTAIAILVMIVVRAHNLANESITAGDEPGFFVPTTASEAVISGFIIWIPGALFVGVLAFALYAAMTRYLGINAWTYFVITLAFATLLSAGLYLNKVAYAPEGTFEMYACGVGYGFLIPFLSSRKS